MQCGLQMLVEDLNQDHHRTGLCQRGWERKCQHAAAVHSQQVLNHGFTAYGEELERMEIFKYLGQLIACNDTNNQAMQSDLRKAQGCWVWVSCVLWVENASLQTCRMFYMATVQAVLLYGSETWSLALSSQKHLEGFHICAPWQMAGKRPAWNGNGSWTYLLLEEALMAVGLKTIAHYVDVRCQTIANLIVNKLIYELCVGAVRKRGLPVCPFWWDQPMDLDLA
jgi:hypothetical protein